jgi:hypothetical protein
MLCWRAELHQEAQLMAADVFLACVLPVIDTAPHDSSELHCCGVYDCSVRLARLWVGLCGEAGCMRSGGQMAPSMHHPVGSPQTAMLAG